MVGHHMLPPTKVTKMTALTYDTLGWRVILGFLPGGPRAAALRGSGVGRKGRVGVVGSSQHKS